MTTLICKILSLKALKMSQTRVSLRMLKEDREKSGREEGEILIKSRRSEK